MGYIQGFGFEIYRLREAKTDNEFLLYDINKKQFNTYNQKRVKEILLKELQSKNIDLVDFIKNKLKIEGEIKPIKTLNIWLDQETILINDIIFYPINERIIEKEGKFYFNRFEVFDTFNKENYKLDKEMSFEEFKIKAPYHYKLFSNLHNFDDEAIQDTLLKIADKVQYPHEKAQDCLIFYPGEGAGKGILYKYVLHPIFNKYTSKILMKKLNNDFNAFLKESLILVLEEGKRDLELIETLKEMVTEGRLLINKKGTDQKEEDIYFLTIVFSNNMNPIDLGKRRGSYHLCKPLGKTIEKSQKIGKELCENLPNETEYLLQYLHNLEFKHQDALMPFNTIAKSQVTDLNKSPLELFYDLVCTFPNIQNVLINLKRRRFMSQDDFDLQIIEKKEENNIIKYISKDMIKEAYNNFCHIEGFKSNLIRHNKDIVQLWALMEIPVESHRRLVIRDGVNAGRRLDHLRLKDINDNIIEKYNLIKK